MSRRITTWMLKPASFPLQLSIKSHPISKSSAKTLLSIPWGKSTLNRDLIKPLLALPDITFSMVKIRTYLWQNINRLAFRPESQGGSKIHVFLQLFQKHNNPGLGHTRNLTLMAMNQLLEVEILDFILRWQINSHMPGGKPTLMNKHTEGRLFQGLEITRLHLNSGSMMETFIELLSLRAKNQVK